MELLKILAEFFIEQLGNDKALSFIRPIFEKGFNLDSILSLFKNGGLLNAISLFNGNNKSRENSPTFGTSAINQLCSEDILSSINAYLSV